MSNKCVCVVSGWIVEDAEVNGKATKFRIGVNRAFKNKETGEWEEKPMWLRCADFMPERSSKLTKGTLVTLTGEMTWDERPEGGFWAPELKIMNVDILRWANSEGAAAKGKGGAQGRRKAEDLPF